MFYSPALQWRSGDFGASLYWDIKIVLKGDVLFFSIYYNKGK